MAYHVKLSDVKCNVTLSKGRLYENSEAVNKCIYISENLLALYIRNCWKKEPVQLSEENKQEIKDIFAYGFMAARLVGYTAMDALDKCIAISEDEELLGDMFSIYSKKCAEAKWLRETTAWWNAWR